MNYLDKMKKTINFQHSDNQCDCMYVFECQSYLFNPVEMLTEVEHSSCYKTTFALSVLVIFHLSVVVLCCCP